MSVEVTLESLEALLMDMRSRLERLEARLQPTPTCLPYPAAAKYLGVGLTKFKELVRSKAVRTVRVGKVPMVPVKELERLSAPALALRRVAGAKWQPMTPGRPRR